MLITKIEQQRHNEKRYSVHIDGEFKFGASDVDILYYKLKEGEEISEERYNDIMDNVIYVRAKDAAFYYLGYKARTEKEVADKLALKGYGIEIINQVIEMLKGYGYIDDRQYAARYVNERTRALKGGRIKLEYELRERGISDEIIRDTFENMPSNEEETAFKLLEKRLKGTKEIDPSEKRRLYGYLARRGFSYDTIQVAFEKYFALFN